MSAFTAPLTITELDGRHAPVLDERHPETLGARLDQMFIQAVAYQAASGS